MNLYAISDLHLSYQANREALEELPAHPGDWLIVAGDVGDAEAQIAWGLDLLARRFARVIWTPGNHDLWSLPPRPGALPAANPRPALRGEALYRRLVAVCRDLGVLTPEDPFAVWPGPGGPHVLAPIFTLYDYSFRPDEVPAERALDWAAESGVICADEALLHPDPHPSRAAWCASRCELTARRLAALPPGLPLVLISHFPLRRDLAVLPRIPRFSLWCGTRRTEDWPARFNAPIVVSGHLHIPRTVRRDGVRFEEVSLGYPREWRRELGVEGYLRRILPE